MGPGTGPASAPGPAEPFPAMELEDDFGEARGGVLRGEGGCRLLQAGPGPSLALGQSVWGCLCAGVKKAPVGH